MNQPSTLTEHARAQIDDDRAAIEDLLQVFVKSLRAIQLYPENNPIHLVRIVSAKDGSYLDQSYLVDLATTDSSGTFERSIVKVTDPTKYGINPSAYFV